MKRIILSIIAGFMISAILSTLLDQIFHATDIYPPLGEPLPDGGLAILAFSYRALFAMLGAYVTAMIAKDKAIRAVLILGTIGSLLWLGAAIAKWEFAPAWFHIIGIATGVPLTLMSGKIYMYYAKNTK
jgi:hypothetical protein